MSAWRLWRRTRRNELSFARGVSEAPGGAEFVPIRPKTSLDNRHTSKIKVFRYRVSRGFNWDTVKPQKPLCYYSAPYRNRPDWVKSDRRGGIAPSSLFRSASRRFPRVRLSAAMKYRDYGIAPNLMAASHREAAFGRLTEPYAPHRKSRSVLSRRLREYCRPDYCRRH